MFDRRVIRGNTYAAQAMPVAPPEELKPKRAPRRKPPGTPDPVEGRRHMDIQTEAYLEELADVVPEAEVTTQTDAFMDRPPTPLFIPMKIGVDVETQIEDGDLFDFDFEVEPLLEVLVGKTLEQGLMEVMEEEELAAMRAHQEHFEQIRNAELVATQRMEAAERRKAEERERRIAQEKERIEREKAMREKVAAQTFARGYTAGLLGNVFDRLYDSGFFFDPVQREIEDDFMPWFEDAVVAECSNAATTRKCVDEIVKKAFTDALAAKVAKAAAQTQEVDEAEAAAEAAAAAEEEAVRAKAEERTAIAERVLAILMEVPEPNGDGGEDQQETPEEAKLTEATVEGIKTELKQEAAQVEVRKVFGNDEDESDPSAIEEENPSATEEEKEAFAQKVIELLLQPPPPSGEDEDPKEPVLTQEKIDEAKAAIDEAKAALMPTSDPDPAPDASDPDDPAKDGEAAASEGPPDAATEDQAPAAEEAKPVPEPSSFEILKHLLEGDLEKEMLADALTPTMEEPTSDKLLEKLLENEETLKAADVAKALVKKALEEEATAAAEKKAAEEAAAAATGADVPAESEPAAVDDSGAAA